MRITLLTCALFVAAPCAVADVLTVGPGGDHADIQAAVDLAVDGDVVLVDAGTYGPFTVVGTGLTVVAEAGAEVRVDGGITVTSLPAGRTLSLVGLIVEMTGNTPAFERPTLLLGGNAGSLRVDGCTLTGAGSGTHFASVDGQEVALVQGCADVSFARCTLTGGAAQAELFEFDPAAPGVRVIGSTVSFHDCEVTGARGALTSSSPPTDGGAGLALESGTVFLSGSTVRGGEGGPGAAKCLLDLGGYAGADGGPGVSLLGPAAGLRRLDSTLLGGPGGPGGVDAPLVHCFGTPDGQDGAPLDVRAGQDVALPGAAHGMTLPTPAREFEPLTLTLSGQPGELCGSFWGLASSSFFKLGLKGQVLLDFATPTFLFVVGALPAGGELSVPFAFDDLGPGWEGLTIHFQSVFAGVDGTYLAAPAVAVILDETL